MRAFHFGNPAFVAFLQHQVDESPPATDSQFSYVVLLLHMEGSDEGTSFTDSSSVARTVTANGNANTEVDQYKFGSSSLQTVSNGDYLSFSDSDDFDLGLNAGYGAEAFTIEFFVRVTNWGSVNVFFGKGGGVAGWNSTNGHQYNMFTESSTLYYQFWNGSSVQTISTSVSSLSNNTWYHIAVSFDGTTTAFFVNGNRVGTSTAGYAAPSAATTFRIAANAAGYSFNGFTDDFRITKGYSRYNPSSTTITVPTSTFPDSA
jgi:hypothetical protein